jgi:hypothetical protein
MYFHAQTRSLSLSNSSRQRTLLDEFKKVSLKALYSAYRRTKIAELIRDLNWKTPRHRRSLHQSIHSDSSHGSDCECAAFDGDDPGKIVRRWDDGFGE